MIKYPALAAALATALYLGFAAGRSQERQLWQFQLGGCALPRGQADATLYYRLPDGSLACQQRGNVYFSRRKQG